jgi:hypothetical protein
MGALSTTQSEVKEAYGSIRWAKKDAQTAGTMEIKTELLETMFARNNVPKRFDLLVVDTEGAEEKIILSLLESSYRPTAVVVELSDKYTDFEPYPELQRSHQRTRNYLMQANYQPHWENHINTVFKLQSA